MYLVDDWKLSIKKVPLPRLRGVAPENRIGILCSQRLQVNVRIFVAELERPEHVHVLSRCGYLDVAPVIFKSLASWPALSCIACFGFGILTSWNSVYTVNCNEVSR